jgi:hypothetical protein
MNGYKEIMDEYVGDPPRTTIDIDELVLRGRRSVRSRRIGAASGALAFFAVAAIAAGSVLAGPAAAPPTPATTSPSAAPRPSASPVDRADRLLAAVRAAIAREAPQVTGLETLVRQMDECELVRLASGRLVPKDGFIKQVPYDASRVQQACPPQWGNAPDDYYWTGRFGKDGKVYVANIHVYRTIHYDLADPPINETQARELELAAQSENPPYRGPNGENVLVYDYLLNMTKPGGIGVFIECHDTEETGAFMIRSPFTRAQLAAIGLDSALHP